MKNLISTLAFLCILAISAEASVWTVSNDSKAPAQFTSINAAIQAASSGDTILVYGSSGGYGTVDIDRQIVLIGAGYRNPYGPNTIINRLNFHDGAGALSASNTKVSGFAIYNIYYYGGGLLEGVLMERCSLGIIYFYNNTVYRNDTIRNCRITNNEIRFYRGSYENVQLHNNIFDNIYINTWGGMRSIDSTYISNCVFVNRGSNVFGNVQDLVIENSIFYAAEPQGCTNCAFNHNMTYLNVNNQLVGSAGNPGSVGSGNYENEDPQFVDFPTGGGAFQYSHDLNVQNPNAVDGGTDGKDMGIHGGLLPYTPGANPGIPQMTEIQFTNGSSVKVGGTLDVTFKAKKQD